MIAVLLFIAPWIAQLGYSTPALCIVTFCMGMENTLYERNGSVTFGLTYMTGALVKIGQGLATLLSGGERLAWLPFLLLWLGLIGGAVAGATLFQPVGRIRAGGRVRDVFNAAPLTHGTLHQQFRHQHQRRHQRPFALPWLDLDFRSRVPVYLPG
jgi:Protein of unknown function (DUF1275)